MAMDYLQDLEHHIDQGRVIYACQGQHGNEWVISSDLEEARLKAQRAANSRKYQVSLFRLINKMDTVTGDSYLFVRKILEPGPKGEPHLNWSLADTREGAEMMRDVSQGPSPYFGATVVEAFEPA